MKKTICVIMAHADDVELSAGGTVAKYAAEGYKVLYGLLSRCNSGWTVTARKGGHYISSLKIVPRRYKEARAAAKVFGAEFYYGDLLENCYTLKDDKSWIVPSFTGAKAPKDDKPTGTPLLVAAGAGGWEDHKVILEVADLLVEWEPEVVLGQGWWTNPDHFAASLIVAKAWQIARQKARIGPYWVPIAAPGDVRMVYPPLPVGKIVDVTGHEKVALQAVACHRSQGGHLPSREEQVRAKWRTWGKKIGVRSAEGFAVMYKK